MALTLRQLFEAKIIYEDDDFVIKQDGKIVIDNRNLFITDEIKNYIDYPIERMYSLHGVDVGNEAILIRISKED